MEIVNVIAVPRTSFNKDRRMSDLVRTQVQHFKHLAHVMGEDAHAEIPHHAVLTEHDAAQFIHAMTKMLKRKKVTAMPARRRTVAPEETVFPIAAEAEEKKPRGKKAKSKTTKNKTTKRKAKSEKKQKKEAKKLKKRAVAAKEKKSSAKLENKKAAKKATTKKAGVSKKAGKRSTR